MRLSLKVILSDSKHFYPEEAHYLRLDVTPQLTRNLPDLSSDQGEVILATLSRSDSSAMGV